MEKEKKKITLGFLASWIFGVLFLITGMGVITSSPFAGVVIILCSAMLIPYFDKVIAEKFNLEISGGIKFVLVIIIFIAMGFGMSSQHESSQTTDTTSDNSDEKVSNVQETDEETTTASSSTSEPTTESTEKQVEIYYLGEPVRVGSYEYTINSVSTTSAIGQDLMGEFMGEKADGIFMVVDVTIENMDSESKTMWDSMVKVIDDQGRTYSHDINAEMYLSMSDKKAFTFEQLQPGLPKQGYLVFDVPADLKGGFEVSSNSLLSSEKKYIAFTERP